MLVRYLAKRHVRNGRVIKVYDQTHSEQSIYINIIVLEIENNCHRGNHSITVISFTHWIYKSQWLKSLTITCIHLTGSLAIRLDHNLVILHFMENTKHFNWLKIKRLRLTFKYIHLLEFQFCFHGWMKANLGTGN